jgi:hypothetical protein
MMTAAIKPTLPPNPYQRSPIKKREDLAGRAHELKTIRYYLSLTASGQSPHLALIGQSGVGKTSLLNGAESLAKELKLLPVRLDMNEQKAKSIGRFWHDFYQTLALSLAKAGCWGGVQGTIYAELLRMLHSRQPGSLEKAVMQIPYVFSCHQGSVDNFECPDALVVNDFEACLSELKNKGFTGIALLIDEADCLGKNLPLLQMFRNIFQIVEHCSLLLAGTDAVFPALSEVFSPIPRQFHRIDIKPFARWSDTSELVLRPIPREFRKDIAPSWRVVEELHELCGGAPDEVQLYCHHMYRTVEDGSNKQMSLAPRVFCAVLREYRANSPANVDAIVNAIERLPDKLLFKSSWLSRRNLTLDENIQVSVLRRELQRNKPLSAEERADVTAELTEGYRKLFEAGIIEIDNCIRLAGAPLTAGFWKSFVEVARGKRWTWNDESFGSNIFRSLGASIGKTCGATGQIYPITGKESVLALQSLRDGKTPPEFEESMPEMILSAHFARDHNSTHVVDVAFEIESPAGKQTHQCRFFEKVGQQLREGPFEEWVENHRSMLASNQISVGITGFNRWELPSSAELHRLAYISEYPVPEVFGPPDVNKAIVKFKEGDIQGSMDIFVQMLADRESSHPRNNLAFCQILTGDIASGLENAIKALADHYEPLFELNKGIAEFLQSKTDSAKESLRHALQQMHELPSESDVEASYVLVLEPTSKKVSSHADLPLKAAILINLWRMGDSSREEVETELTKLYPEKAQTWLAAFTNDRIAQ